MSTYAIGDIQGCFNGLIRLLDKINFDTGNDRLWFVGDLVNRGSESLETLNFIMNLGESAVTVLGNHDFHLLVIAEGLAEPNQSDTLAAIINSPEKQRLIDWVRQQPLMHHDKELNFSIIHAGLPPQWSIERALELSSEVSNILNSDNYLAFLDVMYGNNPGIWDENLTGNARIRFIVNCFTRMRYINNKGALEFSEKGAPGSQGDLLYPWFTIENRKTRHNKIIFGHWSTVHLGTIKDFKPYNVYPIDTGYLWNGELTALRLEDEVLFSIPAESSI